MIRGSGLAMALALATAAACGADPSNVAATSTTVGSTTLPTTTTSTAAPTTTVAVDPFQETVRLRAIVDGVAMDAELRPIRNPTRRLVGRWWFSGHRAISFAEDGTVSIDGCSFGHRWTVDGTLRLTTEQGDPLPPCVMGPGRQLFASSDLVVADAPDRDLLFLYPAAAPVDGELDRTSVAVLEPIPDSFEINGFTSGGDVVWLDGSGTWHVDRPIGLDEVARPEPTFVVDDAVEYYHEVIHDVLAVGRPTTERAFYDLRPGHEGEYLGRCCLDPTSAGPPGTVRWQPTHRPDRRFDDVLLPADAGEPTLQPHFGVEGARVFVTVPHPVSGAQCRVDAVSDGLSVTIIQSRLLGDGSLLFDVASNGTNESVAELVFCDPDGSVRDLTQTGPGRLVVSLGEAAAYLTSVDFPEIVVVPYP